MNKYYLKDKNDLEKVKDDYFKDSIWLEEIDKVIYTYPIVLIVSYADDLEFGDYYQFASVSLKDFSPLLN